MLRNLLICGLIAGACAGLLATGFGLLVGEPAIDQAVAFEEAQATPGEAEEEGPVTRGIQSSIGLLTATVVFGIAVGGLFALAFAVAYGRVAKASPARTALWLAAAVFVLAFLVPFLKYPPNPPAIGDPDTIVERTLSFVAMVAISLLAAVAAVRIRARLLARLPGGGATLAAVAAYLVIVIVAGLALPSFDDVPANFPATTLWEFREAVIGMHLVMWAVIGLVFAAGAQRVMAGAGQGRSRSAAPIDAAPASGE